MQHQLLKYFTIILLNIFCLSLSNRLPLKNLKLLTNALSPLSLLKKSNQEEHTTLILEEDLIKLPHEAGLRKISEIVTKNPKAKILIMINGNQRSGKTKFVRKPLYTQYLKEHSPSLLDEDAYQMDFNSYRGNAPQMYQFIQNLYKTKRIIIYDGINSFKVFRLISDKLLADYGRSGFIAVNLSVEGHRNTPNLYITTFRANAIRKDVSLLATKIETSKIDQAA